MLRSYFFALILALGFLGAIGTVDAYSDFNEDHFGQHPCYTCYPLGGIGTPTFAGTVASISANPTEVLEGETAVITWGSTGIGGVTPSSCTGTNFSTGGATSGSAVVTVNETTTYSVVCTGPGATLNMPAETTVTAVPVPNIVTTASCSASPSPAVVNTPVTWTVTFPGASSNIQYSWGGTDSLSGTTASVQKTYTSTGTKDASVFMVAFSGTSLPSGSSGGDCSVYFGPGSITGGGVGLGGLPICSGSGSSFIPTFEQAAFAICSVEVVNALAQCGDGIDNDGDGRIDTNDYGCSGTDDPNEGDNPQCSDGINNDATEDSLVDFGNDTGCDSFIDTSESPNLGPSGTPRAYIEAVPDRVRANDETTLGWSAQNVTSCTITGTNGLTPITAVVSGFNVATTTGVSGPITTQTTFTIACQPSGSDTVIVNTELNSREF